MKIGQECLNCKKEAGLRCLGCAPAAFFCEDCFSDLHMVVNIFHVPERWQVPTFCLSHAGYTLSYLDDHYVPYAFERCVDVRPAHFCSTQKQVLVKCIDEQGN